MFCMNAIDVRMLHASCDRQPGDVELVDDDWPSLPRIPLMKCVSRSALKNLCRKSERPQITDPWQIFQNLTARSIVMLLEVLEGNSMMCLLRTQQAKPQPSSCENGGCVDTHRLKSTSLSSEYNEIVTHQLMYKQVLK